MNLTLKRFRAGRLSRAQRLTLLVFTLSWLALWLGLSAPGWGILGLIVVAVSIWFALSRLIVTRKRSVWVLKTARPLIVTVGLSLFLTNGASSAAYDWPVILLLSVGLAGLTAALMRYECQAEPWTKLEAGINLGAIFLITNAATQAMALWSTPAWLVLALSWLGFYVIANFWLTGVSDKPETIALIWALLGTELLAISSSWLVFYSLPKLMLVISQPALIIVVLAYSLGGIYYHFRAHKLSRSLIFEYIAVTVLVFGLLLLFTKWSNAI